MRESSSPKPLCTTSDLPGLTHTAGTKLEAGDSAAGQALPRKHHRGDRLPGVVMWSHRMQQVFPPSVSVPREEQVTEYSSFYLTFFLLPEVPGPPPQVLLLKALPHTPSRFRNKKPRTNPSFRLLGLVGGFFFFSILQTLSQVCDGGT